jgi:hypothetical protein
MIDLKKLQRAAVDGFKPLLEKSGFRLKTRKVDKHGFETVFVSDNRYIKLNANCHPRDYPPFFNIILGEGPLEMPESDWNSVALWRMGYGEQKTGEFLLEEVTDAKKFVLTAVRTLESLERGFLTGDLKAFRRVRAEQTQGRTPYLIHKPDKNGHYRTRQEPVSKRLKEKYSKE